MMQDKEVFVEPRNLQQLNKTTKMLLERKANIQKLKLPPKEEGLLRKIKSAFQS